MSSSTNTLRTNEAVAVPPKNGQRKSDSTSEGKPRVGAFFFINHGVENGSISSLSSAPTMYTDAEIMENRTDYPVVVDYALNIATSTHTSVSGLSEVLQKNHQQSRKLFTVFRRKASQAQEATVDLDCETYPNMKSKDNQSALGNRINSTDPTIDIENQPSQEESDRSLPIAPGVGEALSVSQKVSGASDLDLESSIGFAGYINQNFSSNSPRRIKLFFMATCVFLLFSIGAVVAAITSGSNTFDKQANSSKQSVSLNQTPTPPSETTLSSSAASQTVDDAYVPSSTQAPAAHDSNDGAADITLSSTTTASSTAYSRVDSSATTLLTSTTAATASTSSLDPAASSSMSTTAAVTTASSTSATVTTASSTAPTTSTASSTAPTVTTASAAPTVTTASSTASTTTTSSTTITVPAKLSSINLQPLAASNLSDKGKPSFFRYDISEMLTNSLELYKVVMRFQSNVDKKGEMITVEYLPKASNWNCDKCDETDVPSTNSITVGTFVLTGGESVYYMDMSPSFSKGIFGGQMTFKLSHSKRRRVKEDEKKEDEGKNKNDNDIEERAKDTSFLDPTLEIVFVDGDPNEFADLSLASLMEWIEWTEKVHSSSFVDRLL